MGEVEADVKAGRIAADADVVVFNTGAAQKYVEVLEEAARAR